MIRAVILAGGSGTRLWPLSRASYPKQFLALHGEDTLLQTTVKRLNHLDLDSTVFVCNEQHRFLVAEQLRQIDEVGSIILEPASRNTAPAIALAAMSIPEGEDPLLLVLPADHIIRDDEVFCKAVSEALPIAESGKLVTFGIQPHEPNTGYGYIKKGKSFENGFTVEEFVEKPCKRKSEAFLKSGNYLWNSGIFVFKASRYLEELNKYHPEIFKACNLATKSCLSDSDFLRFDEASFLKCPNFSVDQAVMEKTDAAIVIPFDVGWSDIGSWSSLWDNEDKDPNGNVILGDVLLHDVTDSYARTDGKLIAIVGVSELVVVSTKDAVMVANKHKVTDAKIIVNKLKNIPRSEWETHREVFRPWGKYDVLDAGSGYLVKRLTVKSGAKLSVQKHQHRSEHWVVVSGVAKVTRDDKEYLLFENQSTYIPLGAIHALENPREENLEIIEVQSGEYLSEDDIVRFEDRYGREISLD